MGIRANISLTNSNAAQDLQALPKVCLHDHLDGGLRPSTVLELADSNLLPLSLRGGSRIAAPDADGLLRWLEELSNAGSLVQYLKAFDLTTSVMQTEEALYRIAEEFVLDLALDNVIAGEVRWAPEQHLRGGLSLDATVEAVQAGIDAGVKSASEHGRKIYVRQLLTAMRHLDQSMEIATLALRHRDRGVSGFDIAGPEAGFPPSRFRNTFDLLAREMFPVTIHAGEADGIDSILSALVDGRAARIGHGVRITEDIGNLAGNSSRSANLGPVASWVLDQGITLEISPKSNLQTGAIPSNGGSMQGHPFDALYKLGYAVTVNTDNRLVSNTTLTKELEILVDTFRYGMGDLLTFQLNAARGLFLPTHEKQEVIDFLVGAYSLP